MRFATEEELAGHQAATIRGAIEGIGAGFAISLPVSYYFQRTSPYYRNLPASLKAMGVIFVVAPLYAIQAERRGLEFDKSTWTGAGKNVVENKERVAASRWNALHTKEKALAWAQENQYKVILGSWAVSLVLTGGLIWRNKYQTPAQKIVQARMWAQGLTVGILIAAGVMTSTQRAQNASHDKSEDHSWVNMVQEIEKEEAERIQRSALYKPIATPTH